MKIKHFDDHFFIKKGDLKQLSRIKRITLLQIIQ